MTIEDGDSFNPEPTAKVAGMDASITSVIVGIQVGALATKTFAPAVVGVNTVG